MNTREHNFYMLEVINAVAWYRQLTPEKLNEIEFKVRWALKKAISKFMPDVTEFEKMRDEEIKKLQDKWFTNDTLSEAYVEPILDEDGNEEKDEDGNVKTRDMRRVKAEYIDEYQTDNKELQDKLNEILSEKNTYEYNSADIDGFVERIDEPKYLEFSDLEMLDALLSDNGEA